MSNHTETFQLKKYASSQILKSLAIKTENRCNYVPTRRFGRYGKFHAIVNNYY